MKNLSLTLNAVLFVAVAILYYLHFSGKKTENSAPVTTNTDKPLSATPKIVYINSDSLLDDYDFYKTKKSEFEASQAKIKNELRSENEKLQKEIETYQKQAIGMTDKEKAEKEYQLGMKQQQLMQRKDELLNSLDEQQAHSSEELYSKLNEYLKKHNQGRNYSYVLGFQKGGGILYANDSLNITREVIEGLNKDYAAENKK